MCSLLWLCYYGHIIISELCCVFLVPQRLELLNQYPDFNNYLVFIFTTHTSEDEPTRAIAGLILKNNVKLYFSNFPEDIIAFIHQHSMRAIDDSSPLIRATAGTLISTIAMRGGLANWPSLLPTLCQYIESPTYFTCEVRLGMGCGCS